MALYEHVVLARQDISTQQVEALIEQFKTVLEENGGKISKIEPWGLRTLTYRINKNRKAHYVLMNVDAPHAAVAEMERQMGLNEDILRFMTVRVDELDENPSAMMQKKDRDDRRRSDRPQGGRERGPRRNEAAAE
ncbi:30S ribosomal protein S6 [Polycladidibacter stylochi]|uniref:30S ribosomal protein S6 n=1 Tax=Polycladidibacter stylochi TaxID=1807766 RepID=UPI00082AE5DD|nr:30S ribosomal protein S6 [Pseudovibrio stylochi]